jgi:hypothetical protein
MTGPLAGPPMTGPPAPKGPFVPLAYGPPGFGPMPLWGTLYHPPGSLPLHSSISARDSPGLHAQMSMGLEIALASRSHKSLLGLGMLCSSDIKEIDMKFSWIGDGIFAETQGFCEAEGDEPTHEQVRSIEQKIINFHRQERAKAVALVAKYPHLYGKKK